MSVGYQRLKFIITALLITFIILLILPSPYTKKSVPLITSTASSIKINRLNQLSNLQYLNNNENNTSIQSTNTIPQPLHQRIQGISHFRNPINKDIVHTSYVSPFYCEYELFVKSKLRALRVNHPGFDWHVFLHDEGDDLSNGDALWDMPKGERWQYPIQDLMMQYLHAGKEVYGQQKLVIMDIGAHVGFHSMFLAKLGHEVHAFEPMFNSMQLLKCGTDVNRLVNLRLNHFGLSDKASARVCMERFEDESATYRIADDQESCSARYKKFGAFLQQFEQMSTLDTYQSTVLQEKSVFMVHMDTNSSELDIFQGGAKFWESAESAPKVVFLQHATYDDDNKATDGEEIVRFLKKRDYRVFKGLNGTREIENVDKYDAFEDDIESELDEFYIAVKPEFYEAAIALPNMVGRAGQLRFEPPCPWFGVAEDCTATEG